MPWLRRLLVVAFVAAVGLLFTSAPPASAGPIAHSVIVNPDPLNTTPDIRNGTVYDIARTKDGEYIVGGTFTQASDAGSSTVLSRRYILKFDPRTGRIDRGFVPSLDGAVYALWPSTTGGSVYVGGAFTKVNGATSKSVARLGYRSGKAVAGFKVPKLDGTVRDLTVTGPRLWLGGPFKHVNGVARPALATVGAEKGGGSHFLDHVRVSGVHYAPYGGATQVWDMDVSPDGDRMVFIGNFGTVSGADRNMATMLDLTGSTARLRDWRVPLYDTPCSKAFDAPIRDVSWDPTSRYFVIVATGAKAADSLCDAAARFERNGTGDVSPTWVNYTGGDTVSAVECTGAAVYIGGHFRWVNNPYGSDSAGPGAVAREAIAALKPSDGNPYSWNPGHDRGVGIRVLRASPGALWVGSDTSHTGGEYHGKIAGFTTTGGARP